MKEEPSNDEGFDEQIAETFSIENDFDSDKFYDFREKSGIDYVLIDEEALWKLGLAKLHEGKIRVNNACILFFAKNPLDYFRQSIVTCIRYQGNNKTAMIDRRDLDDDLLSIINSAEAFVRKNTKIASKIIGFKRVDVKEYPYAAIREAIINAVCHRNYYFKSTGVFVNIFDDRIEIISPGAIPHGLSLKEVEGKSFPRNYLIHSLFKKAGYVEKSGSGLDRMNNLMKKHGLKEPVYEAGKASFKVTFQGPGKEILDLVKNKNETDLKELELNERQIKTLALMMNEKQQLTNKKYTALFKISKATTKRDLAELLKKNLIRRKGLGKASTYTAK